MPWWGWLSIGIILMGLELTAVDAAFYLIFVGAAAVCVGIIGLAGVELPLWGQLLGFAVLAVTSMVWFRGRLYDRIRGGLPGFEYKVAGRLVSVGEDVPPGGQTRVELQGTQWTAVNVGPAPIAAGARVRVVGRDSLNLSIEGVADDAARETGEEK